MNKPYRLKKGDKVAIVSLSSGVLGETFVKHELDLGLKRLKAFGLKPIIMKNALKGIEYLDKHPEARAEDLKQAFIDKSIKGIICAIGGEDTYRLIPYLMEDIGFKTAVKNNPKLFMGFSDTTINHLMLYRLGLKTFYGPCLLADIAELDNEMLPYTKEYFQKCFLDEDEYEIKSSDNWYYDRESYSIDQLGTSRKINKEEHGFEILNGFGIVTGELYGGCIESIYEAMVDEKQKLILEKYNILLNLEEYENKVLFLETSEQAIEPNKLKLILREFKSKGIFNHIKGMIIGKPINEKYYEDYKDIYKEVLSDTNLPILYNVNFGHSVPRCILQYGSKVMIDYDNKKIKVIEPIFEKNINSF